MTAGYAKFGIGGGVHIRSGSTGSFFSQGGDITFATGEGSIDGSDENFVQRMQILSGGTITMAGETEKVAMSVRGDLNVEQDLTVERDLVVADDLKVTDTISADGLFMAPSATRYRFSTGRYNLVIDRSENRGYEDNILQIPIHVSVGQVIRKISARIRRDIGSNCNSGGFTRMNIVEHDFDSGGEIGIPGVDVPHEVTQLAVFDLSHLVYQVKDRRSYAIQIIARRGDGQFDFNCKLEFRGALVEVEADRFSLGGTR